MVDVRHVMAQLIALLLFATTTIANGQEVVATWLEETGLQRLHARELERLLGETANQETRARIALSLAGLYAELLQSTPAGAQRKVLEDRARLLLDKIEETAGDPLRLTLLRSRYALASGSCERIRLALDIEGTRQALVEELAEIAQELLEVGERLERSERALERRINRTGGMRAQALGARSDGIGMRIAQSTYLQAWARAYLGWLTDDRAEAIKAQKLFGLILSTGDSFPSPTDISKDLRRNEIYAESILGMAFAKSVTDSLATVRTWIDLLDSSETSGYVRDSLPYWRLLLYSEAGAHEDALDLLRKLPDEAPVSWLRLAAVRGLGAEVPDSATRSLGTEAIAILASRGELAQVVDLAERFNLSGMDQGGFALQYVNGVCHYQDAQAAVEAGRDTESLRDYRSALDDLESALLEADSEDFPEAVPGAIAMRAWCLHKLGRFPEASFAFEAAAERHAGVDAGNYLWMALESLDPVKARTVGGRSTVERRAELITRFLNDHPAHPNAPNALLRQFASISDPSLEDAETLVMVPTGTANGNRAYQQGLQLLYRIFRRGDADERIKAGERFLELVPIPRFTWDMDDSERLHAVLRVRQLLDISLASVIARTEIARAALDAIDQAVDAGVIDLTENEREIIYRRLMLALLEGRPEDALYHFGLLENDSDDWTRVAARSLYNAARVVLVDPDLPLEDFRTQYGIDGVRRAAGFLLGEDPETADFTDDSTFRIGRALALAERMAYESSGDQQGLDRAYALFTILNGARPRDEGVLEGLAWSAEMLGDDDAALAALRTLVSGTAIGTERWFRRKHELVRVLARTDPARARDVLEQHVVLHPDYGPAPWGERLSALHAELGREGGVR